ncbi:DUF3617 family protein [Sphingomonas sp. NIBR02145]|uniref:DUF3617 family protein n=1 Tax=Sphingomonas sp. NIBR02145 TaxID=3014784 RepID=UPI0022B507F2|nr:DUF3617 family protein [Sphingomonas sp. NIBR02145]WHU04864.1 DUF3617 family protein [Sphingomonas sp. NIBR02145]
MLKTGFLRVALVLPWLLGACGGQGVANTAAGAEQRGQGAPGSLRSGLYKIVQTGDGGGEEERCITNEIIAAGQYIAVKDLQPGWKIVRNRASGGTVDLEATGPSKGRMVYSGSYTATSFTVDAVMTFEHNGEMMTMKNRETGTFVSGDCGKGEG